MDPLERVFRLAPHLCAVRFDEESLFLLGEEQRTLISGRAFAALIPLIDGRRTVVELMQCCTAVSQPEVLFALRRLEDSGFVTCQAAGPDAEVDRLWHAVGLEPAQVGARLESSPLSVVSPCAGEREALSSALAAAGLCLGSDAGLRLLVVDDYLDPALSEQNRRALEREGGVLLVRLHGAVAWVGPLLWPGRGGPCLECLAQRLGGNRPVEQFIETHLGREALPLPRAGAAGRLGGPTLDLVAHIVSRFVLGQILENTLFTISYIDLELRRHTVVRRPQCPVCGDGELVTRRGFEPLVLQSRPVFAAQDNGHRTVDPSETWRRNEHQIDPLTGVLASLEPAPRRDHPLRPTYVGTWLALPEPGRALSADSFHRTSLGKGQTPAQSRVSALCEAVERWSAQLQGDEPKVRGSFVELGAAAIHPDRLTAFSQKQIKNREDGHAAECLERSMWVPLPLDPDLPLWWTPVWSLTHKRQRMVPTDFCYTGLRTAEEERCIQYDSNGDAVGNCIEEAVLQGLLELVERDAVAIWWYNRLRRPAVDLDSFGEPYFAALTSHYRELGWEPWVLDVTSDLGLPVFVAYAEDATGQRFAMGCGCHLSAHIALRRALTEMNQLFDPGAHDRLPWDPAAVTDPAYLHPDPQQARTTRETHTVHETTGDLDLLNEINHLTGVLAEAGLETLVLDRSRPDVDLSVAKVIVPGLRHFWPRLGQGRLYDVPPAMGWRERALVEEDLNPVPLLI